MGHNNDHSHHIIPFATLTKVFAALVCLTVLTVICARVHLGAFAAPVAFVIAITKALLVISFFMGLKYDSNANRIIFASAFIFLAIFGFFTALDIWTRIAQVSTL